MSHLGQKIKDARKQKGLSQEELADSAKVSLRTIQRIETNKNELHYN
jgi:transcriptional regulator with XRE-family HTH domain